MFNRSKFILNNDDKDKNILDFQIVNIRHGDFVNEDNEDCFCIELFGINQFGKTIHLSIYDFCPYFFIEIPDDYTLLNANIIVNDLKKKMGVLKDYLIDYKIVSREKLLGFTNHKKFKFIFLKFQSKKAMKKCESVLNYNSNVLGKFVIYESNIDPVLRFLHIQNIEPAGWITINNYSLNQNFKSTCHLNVKANYKDVIKSENQNRFANIMCAAFDIECYSDTGELPNPEIQAHKVIMIATVFRKYPDKNSFLTVVHTLKPCNKIKNAHIIVCPKEKELLLSWSKLIQSMDPDFIYGYNSNNFDWNYLYIRATKWKIIDEFLKLDRIINKISKWICIEQNVRSVSNKFGNNKYVDSYGRIVIDIYKEVQRNYNYLDSYKLNNVANEFLNESKEDLSPKQLFKYFKEGSLEQITDIATYCIQDTELCHQLVWKLNFIINAVKMANVCYVPIDYIFHRGEGIKIFSLISKECRDANIIIPVIREKKNYNVKDFINENEMNVAIEIDKINKRYQGAYVLETDGGAFYDPVAVLDFNSLYPSCIIGWNISHDSLIINQKYNKLPNIDYIDIEYIDKYCDDVNIKNIKDLTVKEKKVKYTFVQNDKGILPKILEKLLITRKSIKLQMKTIDKNSFEYTLLDGTQLAYKLVANSCYGQCGAITSPIYCKSIAACTTAKGREMLIMAKDIGNSVKFKGINIEVIYGDSVAGYTPILLKSNYDNEIYIKTIETLGDEWISYNNFKLDDEIRTEKMQSSCNDKVWTDQGWSPIKRVIKHRVNKKMFRIITSKGLVDITEDHSLLTSNLEIIKPNDCQIGTELLHSFPIMLNNKWYDINNNPFENYITNNNNNSIYIPNFKFLVDHKFIFDTQVEAQKVYYGFFKINIKCYINYENNKYILYFNYDHSLENKILKIIDLGYSENNFVYDLETECGRFQAGIGQIIVKNTDSNFYLIKGLSGTESEIIEKVIDIGKKIADIINKSINVKSINIEFEKAFYPYIQITPKKYFGYKFTTPNDKTLITMGSEYKKRGYCAFVKNIFLGLYTRMLNRKSSKNLLIFVAKQLKILIDGQVPLNDLMTTIKLGTGYKEDREPPAQVQLAEKMKQRGLTVVLNDRIPFIYQMVAPCYNSRGSPITIPKGHQYEEISYAIENNIKYDPEVYLESQIKNHITKLIYLIEGNDKNIIKLINSAFNEITKIKTEIYGEPYIGLTPSQKKSYIISEINNDDPKLLDFIEKFNKKDYALTDTYRKLRNYLKQICLKHNLKKINDIINLNI